MQRKHLIFIILTTGVVIWVALATFTPVLEYDPRGGSAPDIICRIARQVEDFFWRSGRLPPPDTPLTRQSGRLEWKSMPESAKEITNITIQRVRFTSGASLLMSVLDDDPTYIVEVVATVTTVDGKQTPLRLTLWDYGLVTPWFVQSRGDGLKPVSVSWN